MDLKFFEKTAADVRVGVIKAVAAAGSGHPGGSLSAADIVTALYFKEMNIDPADPKKAEKVYFQMEACEGGYNLVMASSSREKTYKWISSLSERFSLVEMIATGVVYVKDNRKDTYMPFISEHGKYCRYDEKTGKILEL